VSVGPVDLPWGFEHSIDLMCREMRPPPGRVHPHYPCRSGNFGGTQDVRLPAFAVLEAACPR
jgi:hypothetical protein